MKVYLDDVRNASNEAGYDWVQTFATSTTIELLKTGQVEMLSLDFDLGNGNKFGTGEDVLKWIEEQIEQDPQARYKLPPICDIYLHTMDPVGRKRMQAILDRILGKEI